MSNVTGTFINLTKGVASNAIYGISAHIACLGATDVLRGNVGAFCLFMQGNNAHGIYNPITGDRVIGIPGSLIKSKVLQLYEHGCRACGSVPIAGDNDPNEEGILTLNYVSDNAGCSGTRVCPPTIAADDQANNPLNAGQTVSASAEVVNQTADGTQACAQPGSPVVTDANGVPMDECDVGGPSPNPSADAKANVTSLWRVDPRMSRTARPTAIADGTVVVSSAKSKAPLIPDPPSTSIPPVCSSGAAATVRSGSVREGATRDPKCG